jgi:hypothetical protein
MWPFGKKDSRFHDQAAFERNLAKQTAWAPQTVEQLRRAGMRPGASLRLEYFFYAGNPVAGEALASVLQAKGYSSECAPAADGSPTFCITGWSNPLPMDEENVVRWTDEMCRLGFDHDCEFDGWGATPDQPDLRSES